MIKHKLLQAVCVAFTTLVGNPVFASGSHHILYPSPPSNGLNPAPPTHRHRRIQSPVDNLPNIIPYACGDNVSSVFSHASLLVKSDANFDAGFVIESDPSSSNVPFAPGELSFNVRGSKPGDRMAIFETDVNGSTNGTSTIFVTDNVYSINLASLTQANIKQLSCVFSQKSGSTIVLNTFHLNGINVPFDVNQTIGCSEANR